jgi:glutathione S-transferase
MREEVAMVRLYGAPGRASAAPEAILEEIGAPYEYIHVAQTALRDAAYRKLNPLGQLPTLVDGEHVIWESAAICIYLCDRYPEAGLAPPIDSPDRGRFYQWLFFLSNTLQPAYLLFIYPDRYGDAEGAPAVARNAATKIAALWQQIDDALERGPFLLGDQFSACDVYLYMLSTWHRESIVPMSQFARVRRHIDLVAERPGVKRMMVRNAGH